MEENKNLNEELEPAAESVEEPVAEPVPEVADEQPAAAPVALDKKKIGIFAAIGVVVVGIIVALILLLGGDKGNGGGGNGGGGNGGEDNNPERNAFIESLGGVSETFKGAVSEKSYTTADDAATAFVNDELAGEGIATIHTVKSNGEVSGAKLSGLNIPANLLEGSDSVEEIEVTYNVAEASAYTRSGRAATPAPTKTVKVYVIKYGVDWKYFAPAPITGDTITKSYYDSVFNYEKYKNCTFENNAVIDILVSGDGEPMEMKMTTKQLIKHADGKVYLEQTISYTGSMAEMIDDITICIYLETVGGKVECYVKNPDGDEWIKADLTTAGFTSLDQLVPFHDQYLDYTYFTKTNYGFALGQENAKRYFMQALGAALESMNIDLNMDDAELDMFAEYYVAGGVLSGMRLDADFEWSIAKDGIVGVIKEAAHTELKCTDYGTTVIERPFAD